MAESNGQETESEKGILEIPQFAHLAKNSAMIEKIGGCTVRNLLDVNFDSICSVQLSLVLQQVLWKRVRRACDGSDFCEARRKTKFRPLHKFLEESEMKEYAHDFHAADMTLARFQELMGDQDASTKFPLASIENDETRLEFRKLTVKNGERKTQGKIQSQTTALLPAPSNIPNLHWWTRDYCSDICVCNDVVLRQAYSSIDTFCSIVLDQSKDFLAKNQLSSLEFLNILMGYDIITPNQKILLMTLSPSDQTMELIQIIQNSVKEDFINFILAMYDSKFPHANYFAKFIIEKFCTLFSSSCEAVEQNSFGLIRFPLTDLNYHDKSKLYRNIIGLFFKEDPSSPSSSSTCRRAQLIDAVYFRLFKKLKILQYQKSTPANLSRRQRQTKANPSMATPSQKIHIVNITPRNFKNLQTHHFESTKMGDRDLCEILLSLDTLQNFILLNGRAENIEDLLNCNNSVRKIMKGIPQRKAKEMDIFIEPFADRGTSEKGSYNSLVHQKQFVSRNLIDFNQGARGPVGEPLSTLNRIWTLQPHHFDSKGQLLEKNYLPCDKLFVSSFPSKGHDPKGHEVMTGHMENFEKLDLNFMETFTKIVFTGNETPSPCFARQILNSFEGNQSISCCFDKKFEQTAQGNAAALELVITSLFAPEIDSVVMSLSKVKWELAGWTLCPSVVHDYRRHVGETIYSVAGSVGVCLQYEENYIMYGVFDLAPLLVLSKICKKLTVENTPTGYRPPNMIPMKLSRRDVRLACSINLECFDELLLTTQLIQVKLDGLKIYMSTLLELLLRTGVEELELSNGRIIYDADVCSKLDPDDIGSNRVNVTLRKLRIDDCDPDSDKCLEVLSKFVRNLEFLQLYSDPEVKSSIVFNLSKISFRSLRTLHGYKVVFKFPASGSKAEDRGKVEGEFCLENVIDVRISKSNPTRYSCTVTLHATVLMELVSKIPKVETLSIDFPLVLLFDGEEDDQFYEETSDEDFSLFFDDDELIESIESSRSEPSVDQPMPLKFEFQFPPYSKLHTIKLQNLPVEMLAIQFILLLPSIDTLTLKFVEIEGKPQNPLSSNQLSGLSHLFCTNLTSSFDNLRCIIQSCPLLKTLVLDKYRGRGSFKSVLNFDDSQTNLLGPRNRVQEFRVCFEYLEEPMSSSVLANIFCLFPHLLLLKIEAGVRSASARGSARAAQSSVQNGVDSVDQNENVVKIENLSKLLDSYRQLELEKFEVSDIDFRAKDFLNLLSSLRNLRSLALNHVKLVEEKDNGKEMWSHVIKDTWNWAGKLQSIFFKIFSDSINPKFLQLILKMNAESLVKIEILNTSHRISYLTFDGVTIFRNLKKFCCKDVVLCGVKICEAIFPLLDILELEFYEVRSMAKSMDFCNLMRKLGAVCPNLKKLSICIEFVVNSRDRNSDSVSKVERKDNCMKMAGKYFSDTFLESPQSGGSFKLKLDTFEFNFSEKFRRDLFVLDCKNVLQCWKSLKCLKLNFICLPQGFFKDLCNNCGNYKPEEGNNRRLFKRLEILELSNVQINYSQLIKLIRMCPSLTHLTVKTVKKIQIESEEFYKLGLKFDVDGTICLK